MFNGRGVRGVVRYGSWDPVREQYRSPKGRRGSRRIRRVPLFGVALDAAKRWLALLPSYAPANPLGLVFPTRRGKRRDQKPPRSWKTILGAFGVVPRIGKRPWWHLLRHTCASSLVSGCWGTRWLLEDVQRVLGHADFRTTQRYAHLAPTALQETAARAQAAFVTVATRPPSATTSPAAPSDDDDGVVTRLSRRRDRLAQARGMKGASGRIRRPRPFAQRMVCARRFLTGKPLRSSGAPCDNGYEPLFVLLGTALVLRATRRTGGEPKAWTCSPWRV